MFCLPPAFPPRALFIGSLHTDHDQPAWINLLYCLTVYIQACTAMQNHSYAWAVVGGLLCPGSTSLALRVDLRRYKQSLDDLHDGKRVKGSQSKTYLLKTLISCHLPKMFPEITVLFQSYISVPNMSFASSCTEDSIFLASWDRSQHLLIHGFVRFQTPLPRHITQFIETLCLTA